MRILISGVCGFVGSTLAEALLDQDPAHEIVGFDNLSRAGSHLNVDRLGKRGVSVHYADARSAADLEGFQAIDWIIDAAANPSVLAGVDGKTSSRQLIEHNLYGTVNMLEYCKQHRAGFILLSTSRVYSIPPLASIPVESAQGAFHIASQSTLPAGVTAAGI